MKAGEFDFEMKLSGTPSSWSWSWSSMLTLERVSAPAQDFIVTDPDSDINLKTIKILFLNQDL